jgi:hypothetical protein
MSRFQGDVDAWMADVFSVKTRTNVSERAFRFLEEALELFQAMGGTQEQADGLAGYVFGRPVGREHQEVGGVMITLAAACSAMGHEMNACATAELNRVHRPEVIAKIKAKRATRAVPGDYTGEG